MRLTLSQDAFKFNSEVHSTLASTEVDAMNRTIRPRLAIGYSLEFLRLDRLFLFLFIFELLFQQNFTDLTADPMTVQSPMRGAIE